MALAHGATPGLHYKLARAGDFRISRSGGCVKLLREEAWQCVRCSGQSSWVSQQPESRRPLFSGPAKTCLEAGLGSSSSSSEKLLVITASTREELLAAATLRAQIFYTYPQADLTLSDKARVANQFHNNDLLKTRVKSEFDRESKFDALGMRVKCLLAVCRQSALASLRGQPYSRLAAPSVGMDGDEPLVAIGTLDIQDGTGTKATADVNLVTFQLYALAHKAQQMKKQVQQGKKGGVKSYFPVEQEDTLEQAYIFNVGVIQQARRMGVAKALMVAALKVAKQMELQILFVHVEADNESALALYNSLGYEVEEEESVEVESLLRRPRRILLSFWVL